MLEQPCERSGNYIMSAFPRFRIRYQISIASAILVIIVALTLATLASVYVASSKAANESAEALFGAVSQGALERLDRMVGATLKLAGLGAAQPRLGTLSETGLDFPALPILHAALTDEAALYSLYYGFENGDFLQLIATRGDIRVLEAHAAPEQTAWIVRSITRAGPARRQVWTFLDADRRQIGRQVDQRPDYDPRNRPWYVAGRNAASAQLSSAYVFNSLKQPGITASKRLDTIPGVFGVDITLAGLEQFVAEQSLTPSGGMVLFYDSLQTLAMSATLRDPDQRPLADMTSVRSKLVQTVVRLTRDSVMSRTLFSDSADGELLARLEKWRGGGREIGIAVIAPVEDFSGPVRAMQKQILLAALAALALFLPCAWLFSSRMARTVNALAAEAERIQKFDFSNDVSLHSWILEFEHLGTAFHVMKENLRAKTRALEISQEKLKRLVDLGIAMSAERDSVKLTEMVLLGAKELTNADGSTLYIVGPDRKLHFHILRNDTMNSVLGGTSGNAVDMPHVPLFDDQGKPNHSNVVSHAVHQQQTVNIADAYDSTEFDFSGTKAFDARTGYRSKSFITVPLKPRGGEVIGALQLINARAPGTDEVIPFGTEIQRFVEALAAQAATALYNRELLDAQENLVDSMIELIAGAIDAKSPYTGGHCERVPELAMMLAHAAASEESGPLATFRFETEEQWREFRIGAWLHDCGKVITPEHVVDKATKLETIYNRIHEVRTRFEILLRDAEIDRLLEIAAGTPETEANARKEQRARTLTEDFAFVAECNIGGEFMAPEAIQRLKSIAARTWMRHFNDRLGLAHDELEQFEGIAEDVLPVREFLLSDKPQHIIARPDGVHRSYEKLGFKVNVPSNLYNRGEIHNLTIRYGTLTEEDRYKINEHIMQTIAMLERLSFPRNLSRVPEYAGTHHETLRGTGYPRKLTREELSVPSRIMAIADIFEALTATDRPYKKANSLSESVKILSSFKRKGHIDPDLFDLFLKSGVYQEYAERFLDPDQIDEVDIADYLTADANSDPAPLDGQARENLTTTS
jgi:HD-GYP domain-containing protein (c-di-GMP phosphodiesterase class II)